MDAVRVDLTHAQARGLVRIADAVRPHLPLTVGDAAARDAVVRGVEALRRAIAAPCASTTPWASLDAVLAQMSDEHAADVLERRVRDVLAVATLWEALERAADAAWAAGDAAGVGRCAALLRVEAIDAVEWRGEAVELLEATGVAFTLPDEGRSR